MLIVSIRHLVYVTLYRWPFGVQVWMRPRLIQTCTPNGHLYRLTYTRHRIDTINSHDDGHMAARNMERIEINIHEKELCVKLVIYKGISKLLLIIEAVCCVRKVKLILLYYLNKLCILKRWLYMLYSSYILESFCHLHQSRSQALFKKV